MACRLSLLLVAALFFLVCVSPSFANSSDTYQGYPVVKVIVNGHELKNDIPAIVLDGRTLVPLRSVYEALGANVQWDPSTNTVYISFPAPGSPQQSKPVLRENVIRIGLLTPLSGDVKNFGESINKGFRLALEENNYRAGNYRIEAVIADDRNDPAEAVNMAIKLIHADKVSAIVGPLTSLCAIPVADIAQKEKVPVISPTATNPKVTVNNGRRMDFVFRVALVDPYQGTAAARFALENLKLKTAAVIADGGNDYSLSLANNFKEAFEKGGGQVLAFEKYIRSDVDFTTVLKRIAQLKPDVLYLPDYYINVNLIGKQARQMGIQSVFLGPDGWDSPNLDYATMEGSYFTVNYSPEDPCPEISEWVEKYRDEYGTEPDMFATLAYDAVKILLQAIQTADSRDPVKIKEALQNTRDLPAVSGRITFDQDGNPVKPVPILRIKDGKRVHVTNVAP